MKKLKKVPLAIFKPIKTYKNLDKSFPFALIISLFFFRILKHWGHYLIIHFDWATRWFQNNTVSVFLKEFTKAGTGFNYISLFMIGSVGIYLLGKLLKSKEDYNYETVEEGMFFAMITPLFLLIFGIPHIFIETPYIWKVCFHIPMLILLGLMPLQLSCLLKKTWGISRKYTFIPLIAIPFFFKWRDPLNLQIPKPIFPIITPIVSLTVLAFYFKKRKWKRFTLFTLIILLQIIMMI